MPIIYSFSIHPTFQGGRQYCACAKRVRSQKQPQRRVKHTERLVQKNSVKRLASATLEIESVTNRANRVGVIRRTQSEDGRRRTHGDAFARPFSFLVRRRRRQTPSLRLSNSLTVCGLALPPD